MSVDTLAIDTFKCDLCGYAEVLKDRVNSFQRPAGWTEVSIFIGSPFASDPQYKRSDLCRRCSEWIKPLLPKKDDR